MYKYWRTLSITATPYFSTDSSLPAAASWIDFVMDPYRIAPEHHMHEQQITEALSGKSSKEYYII